MTIRECCSAYVARVLVPSHSQLLWGRAEDAACWHWLFAGTGISHVSSKALAEHKPLPVHSSSLVAWLQVLSPLLRAVQGVTGLGIVEAVLNKPFF